MGRALAGAIVRLTWPVGPGEAPAADVLRNVLYLRRDLPRGCVRKVITADPLRQEKMFPILVVFVPRFVS